MKDISRRFLWQLTRRFLAECTAAFMANFATLYTDRARKYATFVNALVVGSAVYCAIFATFVVCGAQINPMTTLAVVLSRRMSVIYVPFYLVAQLMGTLLAFYIGLWLSPFTANRTHLGMPMPGPGVSDGQAIGMEIIITFFLELAIVGLLDELRPTSFHFTNKINAFVLLVMVFFWIDTIALPISGACTNPARCIAAAIINLNFDRQYIYLVGPPVGSALAVLVQEASLSPDASWKRLIAMFNYLKPFNRHEFHTARPTSDLPPQAQNANVDLDYFRLTTTLSTISLRPFTSGSEPTRLRVSPIFPTFDTKQSSRNSLDTVKVIVNKPSQEQVKRRRK